MGLAEPRKRIKISQDPNNLTWARSAESYGQKLLYSHGWKHGEGLGSRRAKNFSSIYPAVNVSYRDGNLGLGAAYKSANVEHARTGLDAFQGLLAKLNSKDEAEATKLEQRSEDRRLALWTQGRWGGIVFVPGGLLVQGDASRKAGDERCPPENHTEIPVKVYDQKAARRAAKALRKTARRARQEAKLKLKTKNNATGSTRAVGEKEMILLNNKDPKNKQGREGRKSKSHDIVRASPGKTVNKNQKELKGNMLEDESKKHPDRLSHPSTYMERGAMGVVAGQPPAPSDGQKVLPSTDTVRSRSRNARHIIRGRNIEAKKMAFADAKTLDEIFMKES